MTAKKRTFEKIDPEKMKRRVIGSEDAPRLYSDSIEVGSSLFDFKLHIRVTLDKTEDEVIYRHLCSLHISPPHFKKLISILTEHLEAYESAFGEIAIGHVEDPSSASGPKRH